MIYERDWFMRQLQILIHVLAKTMLGKDFIDFSIENYDQLTPADKLHQELLRLLGEGEINEAENHLFAALESGLPGSLEVALDFYNRISLLPEEYLVAHDFSMEEALEGLRDVQKLYGFDF